MGDISLWQKSIKEIEDFKSLQGIAVYLLDSIFDSTGTWVWEGISIKQFIREFPQYEEYIIEAVNDYFDQTVLRIINKEE